MDVLTDSRCVVERIIKLEKNDKCDGNFFFVVRMYNHAYLSVMPLEDLRSMAVTVRYILQCVINYFSFFKCVTDINQTCE